MNTPENHQNEPPILPDRNIPEDLQLLITDFLCGNMNMNQKGALREKINVNPEFKAYVSGLVATEARLAALLAESRYQEAEPKEPPTWALERLRGAVVQVNRSGAQGEGALARVLNCLTMHRLVMAGSVAALVAVLVIVLPKWGNQSSELMADSPEIKGLLNLSPETFFASVGSPNVVRSAGRYIYSPSGVTSQIDPIVLLSPDLNLQNMKIEVSAPGKPEWIPIQGDFSGVPQPVSKILQKSASLQAGEVYQIRLISGGKIVSEETFRISELPEMQLPQSPSALLRAALGAVNDVPPRPGDALSLLALLPEKHQEEQAVIRVRYKALTQIDAVSEANSYRKRIR